MTGKKLTFDTVEAISVGGSYIVGADGKATRNHEESTSLESIAKGAPGAADDLKGSAVGVSPAHSEASTSDPKAASAKKS